MIILNKFDVISDFFVTLSSLVDKEWTIETIWTDSGRLVASEVI